MTFEEKLRAMEELWESISSNESLVEVPDWHLDALRATDADIQAGREPLLDGDAAKADLRKRAERLSGSAGRPIATLIAVASSMPASPAHRAHAS